MKRNCVFTIVAKNYIGLAEILGKSLLRYNPDVDFKIIVADEFRSGIQIPHNVIIAKDVLPYSHAEWRDMSFKYNLTEFCTSIKPGMFKYLFGLGYERIIYLDPDIFVYSSLSEIFEILVKKDYVLTPQVIGIHKYYNGEHPEWHMNVNGIFNLGFAGISKSKETANVLDWWEERLKDSCFSERSIGQFTDQKWMDWIPALLSTDRIQILRNLGMNVAPWNFFERKFERKDDSYYVSFRDEQNNSKKDKLVFIHFSGYNYKKMKKGIVEHQRMNLSIYPDLKEAIEEYGKEIFHNASTFDKFINESYSYSTFDNGEPITELQRRLYHAIPYEKRIRINPFSTGQGSFHEELKRKKLTGNKSNTKISPKNIPNIEGKKQVLNKAFSLVFKIIGAARYAALIKSLRFYALPEEHSFLINSDSITK